MKNIIISILLIFSVFNISADESPYKNKFKRNHVYPNGRMEVSLLGNMNSYFGEFDANTGTDFGFQLKYNLPVLPFIGFGARYTTGHLSYTREFKDRFTSFYYEQFPVEYYENSQKRGIKKETAIDNFSAMMFINLFPNSQLNVYMQGGFGVLRAQNDDIKDVPRDEIGQKLFYKDFKEQDEFDYHWFAGFGADYFVFRDFSVGVQASFKFLNNDLLDGFAHTPFGNPTENDYYLDYGLKVSYFLFYDDDFDGDGISNEDEMASGTNPYSLDSDNDGINDIDEIEFYNSNPSKYDSDEDGLSDGQELVFNTDMNNSDSDEDGLSDYKEIVLYKSDPNNKDTDNDGLDDLSEVQASTDLLNRDSDDDGFIDSKDKCPSVFGLAKFGGCPQTEPLYTERIVRDTIIERIAQDTVFLVKKIENLKTNDIYRPRGIFFQKNSSAILIESELVLDEIAEWLNSNENINIEIHGHTDNDGNPNFNKDLSRLRAKSVMAYLITIGVSDSRLHAKGFGSEQPLTANISAKDKAKNRRIEFLLYDGLKASNE